LAHSDSSTVITFCTLPWWWWCIGAGHIHAKPKCSCKI